MSTKSFSAAMTMNINPFVVSGHIPAEYFCGRRDEAQKLLSFVKNQQNVVLTAPRRMGKTSLVDFVFEKEEIAENFITISIDILDTSNLNEFVYVLGKAVFEKLARSSDKLMKLFVSVMRSVSGSFGFDPLLATPTFDLKLGDLTEPEYTLREIFEFLDSAPGRCLVVIDEFQQVVYYPEQNVEATLRKYIQKVHNANFVFAGSHRRLMSEIFGSQKRPFFNSARSLELDPIPADEYIEFVHKHFHAAGKDIDAEAIDFVWRQFRGVTLYVQQIMNDAFNITPHGETCDIKTITMLLENYISECSSKLREIMQFVTEPQKAVMYAILQDQPVREVTSSSFTKRHRLKSPSSTQSALKALLRSDLVTIRDGLYSISDPLMSLWLLR